jgi:DNA gyrase subunit A
MSIERPDLTGADPQIVAYIEYLEAQVQGKRAAREQEPEISIPLEPSEPPTTLQLITITPTGIAKRTSRHLYTRQRRGGMGIFDLDTGEKEAPSILAVAEETQSLLLFTNLARVFRVPVSVIPSGEVRSRGQSITGKLRLEEGELLAAAIPDIAKGSIAMLGEKGAVRILRHHVFGEYMKPGTVMFDVRHFGPLVAACRTAGDAELFIATRQGRAIRFAEKIVPPQGGLGVRLEGDDQAVAVAGVYPDSRVFMLAADGRGAIRSMESFNPNKSAGGGGKFAMSTDSLAAAFAVEINDDIFAISRLSKIIRFMAAEVPVKDGVVQGVNCMSLRADEVACAVKSS